MSTVSTLPTVKAQLVTLLTAALDVPVFYAWRPDVTDECVFLGRPLFSETDAISSDITIDSEIPTIKAGRKQRQETYAVPGTVWSFRPELTPADAATAELRGMTLSDAVDDALADDPTLGLASIQWATLADRNAQLRPYERGWVSVVFFNIAVRARLT